MKRVLLCLAAVALLLVPTVRAQRQVVIQSPQVSGITNTTTTRASLNIASTVPSDTLSFAVNYLGGGAATGTLNLFIQDSFDGGVTWHDLVACNSFTFGGSTTVQRYTVYNGEGPGNLRTIAGTQPAAGAEINETVPAGVRWELMAFRAQLITDANVATRVVILRLTDGTTDFFRSDANFSHTATNTALYHFGEGQMTSLTGHIGGLMAGLPSPNRLMSGYKIQTLTSSIQVGDQYSGINYSVREWRLADGSAQVTESFPAGVIRSGPWGNLLRVREKVSGVGGSPTGVTYSISAILK